MFPRVLQGSLVAVTTLAVVLVAGCAPATPVTPGSGIGAMSAPGRDSAAPASPESQSAAAAPAPALSAAGGATPTPIDVPLLTITGGAVGPGAEALTVRLTLVDVSPVTAEALDEIAPAGCETITDLSAFEDPDARLVTFDVEATASPGFTEWTGSRGVNVSGLLFDGSIFETPSGADDPCVPRSLVVRPGVGRVQVPVGPEAWDLPGGLPADGAVTLGQYGLSVLPFDDDGEPTGIDEVTGCSIEASAELDQLAMAVAPAISWGSQSPAREYCLYGRVLTDY